MRDRGAPAFRSCDGVLESGGAGRGVALVVSIDAMTRFLSWCAVIGVDLLVFPQKPLLAAASHTRQTP